MVRAIVGPTSPVGVVLDPHAHLTRPMLDQATVLCFQKEYPHIDGVERLEDAWRICLARAERGEVAPVPAVHDCKMVSFWPTQSQPMRGFVDRMLAREGRDGILSISFVHGFPWGDTPVTGREDAGLRRRRSRQGRRRWPRALGQEIWDLREETQIQQLSLEAALERMAAVNLGPLVVADIADNAGGGAPADSTFVARAVLERGLTDVGLALMYDPQAVAFCHEVGVGAEIDLRIGGKLGPSLRRSARRARHGAGPREEGDPGRALRAWSASATRPGSRSPACTSSWPRSAPSASTRPPSPRSGSTRRRCRSLVVKSTNHFRAGFDPIATDTVYVDTPGAIRSDFANIPYQRFTAPYWPKVDDP